MKKLFKIKINGPLGEYFYVTKAEDADNAKDLCNHWLSPIEKQIGPPMITTKSFIKGVLPVGSTSQQYWRVFSN